MQRQFFKYKLHLLCILLFVSSPAYCDQLPMGYFDIATSTINGCSGWTLDADAPTSNLAVHFYIEDLNNPPYFMTIIGSATANLPRPDVNTATGYPGNHGFAFTVPVQHRYKKIYAFAINIGGSTNPQLTGSPLVIDGYSNLRYSFYMDTYTNRKLELDLYGKKLPTKKPLIVMVHGGAFIAGDKTGFASTAKALADAGYMVACINYRLMGDPDGTGTEPFNLVTLCNGSMINEISWYWAIQDLNAAIKFLAFNENTYGVDKNKVFLYGESAGAITVLQLAYATQQEIYNALGGQSYFLNTSYLGDLNHSTHPPCAVATYTIKGVGSVAGALTRSSFLQSNETIPFLMLHSPCDKLVNYNIGNSYWGGNNPTSCARTMWGSKYINDKFELWQSQGINVPCHKLYTACSTHAYGYNTNGFYPDHGISVPEIIQFRENLFLNFTNTIIANGVCSSTPPVGPIPGLTLNPYCYANFTCADLGSPYFNFRVNHASPETSFDESIQQRLKCYPNPAQNEITLSAEAIIDRQLTICFYNSMGEKMLEQIAPTTQTGNWEHHIELKKFIPGLYIVVVQGENYLDKIALIKN